MQTLQIVYGNIKKKKKRRDLPVSPHILACPSDFFQYHFTLTHSTAPIRSPLLPSMPAMLLPLGTAPNFPLPGMFFSQISTWLTFTLPSGILPHVILLESSVLMSTQRVYQCLILINTYSFTYELFPSVIISVHKARTFVFSVALNPETRQVLSLCQALKKILSE